MDENEEKMLKFIWKIENYSYCWKKKNSFLLSPVFEMEVNEGSSWRIHLHPRGVSSFDKWVSVYLERVASNSEPLEITVDFEIALLRSDGKAEYVEQTKNRVFGIGHAYGFVELAKQEDILGSKESILLPNDILTVQCRVFRKGFQLKMYTEIIAKTHLELENFVFRWESKCCLFDSSSELYTLNLLKGRENMSFQLERKLFNQVEYLCISFETIAKIKTFRFKIYILDCNYSISRCLLDYHYFDICAMTVSLIPVDQIWQQSSLYLRDNKLTLQCDLTISFGMFHSQIEMVTCDDIFPIIPAKPEASEIDKLQNSQVYSCTSFKNDFQTLFQEGTLCDFTLNVGSENIQVHKAMLGARSPVFKAMLTSNMSENEKNMVDISDLDANTVRLMLNFMYTDAIGDLDFETANKLYFAADKYDIMKLKRLCSNFLIQKLCLANFGNVLKLSDLHGDDYLKKISVKFLCDNETVIMRTTEWKTFVIEEPQLAAEIMHCIHLRKPE